MKEPLFSRNRILPMFHHVRETSKAYFSPQGDTATTKGSSCLAILLGQPWLGSCNTAWRQQALARSHCTNQWIPKSHRHHGLETGKGASCCPGLGLLTTVLPYGTE